MSGPWSRRLFLSGLAAGSAGIVAGGPAIAASAVAPLTSLRPPPRPSRGGPDPDRLVAAANLGGNVSFLVADARTGEMLEARNASAPMPPASTAKVLTTLFAFDRLGPAYRFPTRVVATGAPSGGTVAGVVLAGGGDPTLDTDGLEDLARALEARGVKKVDGALGYYAGALPYRGEIAPGQPDHLAYNPAVSGLNLNFNRVWFEWKKQGADYAVTMDARTERLRPAVRCATMALANRSLPVYSFEDDSEAERWTVARGALGKAGGRWLPVRHPGRYAAEVFRSLAASQGVAMGLPVEEPPPAGGIVLAERQSAPLTEIAREMLKFSTNLTAEVLGLSASGAADQASSARAMNAFLAERYGATGITMEDHSGLGPSSRVTALDMVSVLVGGSGGPLPPLLKPVWIRDPKGRPAKDNPVQVHAKTGTLNFVSSLVGYADVPGGRRLAFAILTGDIDRRSALDEDERDRPPGAASWNARSKNLQGALLERWGTLFAA